MFAHVSLGVSNIKRSLAFYDPVMATLGYDRLFGAEEEEFMAYGPEDSFFIINRPLEEERGEPQATNGTHICLKAPSKEAVDEFHKSALEQGGTSNGEPGIRPQYNATYYAAFILDPDGHKIEALFHLES
jgi:catechol 2,3-dioxygenase-like lactoylglutathione lyase family enzyme